MIGLRLFILIAAPLFCVSPFSFAQVRARFHDIGVFSGVSIPFNAEYGINSHASTGSHIELAWDWNLDKKLALGAEFQFIHHSLDENSILRELKREFAGDMQTEKSITRFSSTDFKHRIALLNLRYIFPLSPAWWIDSKSGMGINFYQVPNASWTASIVQESDFIHEKKSMISAPNCLTLVFSTGLGISHCWNNQWGVRFSFMYYNSTSLSYVETKTEEFSNASGQRVIEIQQAYKDVSASWLNLQVGLTRYFRQRLDRK